MKTISAVIGIAMLGLMMLEPGLVGGLLREFSLVNLVAKKEALPPEQKAARGFLPSNFSRLTEEQSIRRERREREAAVQAADARKEAMKHNAASVSLRPAAVDGYSSPAPAMQPDPEEVARHYYAASN